MNGRLPGKVAVITGRVSGIGWQTSQLFVAEGARVIMGDRNATLLGQCGSAPGSDSCATAVVEGTNPPLSESRVS